MYNRCSLRRTILWIIFSLQFILISTYFYLQLSSTNIDIDNYTYEVRFVQTKRQNGTDLKRRVYYVRGDQISLNVIETNGYYADLNSSICYKNGTDLGYMKRSHTGKWRCECYPSFHGNDCSQPENIWRALMAYNYKKPVKISTRKFLRRLVYVFNVDVFQEPLTDIRVNELNDVVDLFILLDREGNVSKRLDQGFLSNHHSKILYLRTKNFDKRLFKELRMFLNDDDLILINDSNEIPAANPLQFFKLHNGFPEPIDFRLKWVVYGFFWQNPSKTMVPKLAELFTVKSLRENFNVRNSSTPLIVGDLNHYGGYYCEFCVESSKMVDFLKKQRKTFDWSKVGKNGIDNEYVEDLIENGIYMDGKTNLLRVHRSQELYYAPKYVVDNSWLYDWLTVNMYNVLDY